MSFFFREASRGLERKLSHITISRHPSFQFLLTWRYFVAELRDYKPVRGRLGQVLYAKSHQNRIEIAWKIACVNGPLHQSPEYTPASTFSYFQVLSVVYASLGALIFSVVSFLKYFSILMFPSRIFSCSAHTYRAVIMHVDGHLLHLLLHSPSQLGAKANQDGDGNVRNQEKTDLLNFFSFFAKVLLPSSSLTTEERLWYFLQMTSFSWKQPKNDTFQVAREARPPRDHVNFTYSRAPFVFCN